MNLTPATPLAEGIRDCPDNNCDFSTSESLENCPKCGTALQGDIERRRYGSLMVAMGGLLALMMGFVILGLVGLAIATFADLLPSTDPRGFLAMLTIGIIWCFTLLGAGVSFFNAGRYQQETGQRDRRMIGIAFGFIFGGLAFITIARLLIGD